MAKKNPETMYETLAAVFGKVEHLSDLIEASIEQELEAPVKRSITRAANELRALMEEVVEYEKDVTSDVLQGMEQLLANAEAVAKGRPLLFNPDEENYSQAA